MKDPYVLEDGTLKNLLGITDYKELQQAETDIGYVKLINADRKIHQECNPELLRRVHKHIFGDIFDWAGEYRTVPLYKTEVVIPGLSLEYARPEDIEHKLENTMNEMNEFNWEGIGIDEITKNFSRFIARIWRIHPFRDGNTRATLTFSSIFAKQHGFEMDMSTLLDYLGRVEDEETGKILRYSLRDKLVLAALDEKDCPEPEHFEILIKQAIEYGISKKIDSLSDIIER